MTDNIILNRKIIEIFFCHRSYFWSNNYLKGKKGNEECRKLIISRLWTKSACIEKINHINLRKQFNTFGYRDIIAYILKLSLKIRVLSGIIREMSIYQTFFLIFYIYYEICFVNIHIDFLN